MGKKLKVLIISFYYAPDLSAGSFRASSLVEAFLRSSNFEIDVVTTSPNRYKSFLQPAAAEEQDASLKITRIGLPAHRSGMIDQSKAFLAFARGVMGILKYGHYDIVVGTSSRLMTAALAAYVAKKLCVPLYLDIRDIFADSVRDLVPRASFVLRPAFSAIERWTINRAVRVNLVSEGFRDYFFSRYPRTIFSFFSNGIDRNFANYHWGRSQPPVKSAKRLTILYAGNVGQGQGLHKILPELARRLHNCEFKVIGDGGSLDALFESCVGLHNVELISPMMRDELMLQYDKADVLFLHLNDFDAFRKVLPSKVFEYGATGKPILAGVAGYAADFVGRELSNAAVFPPCDADAAIRSLNSLSLNFEPRPGFVSKYLRTSIMDDMVNDIFESVDGGVR